MCLQGGAAFVFCFCDFDIEVIFCSALAHSLNNNDEQEVAGEEYSFASGAGVFTDTPKSAGGATFSHSIKMGNYEGSAADIRAAVADLRDEFGPDKYNVLLKNCNHFSDAFCQRLIGARIPAYVNRMANIGSCFSCLLPKEALSSAPVGDPGAGAGAGASGGGFGGGSYGRIMQRNGGAQSSNTKAFQGSGNTLGTTAAPTVASIPDRSSQRDSSSENDALVRREKARIAAMKRMGGN